MDQSLPLHSLNLAQDAQQDAHARDAREQAAQQRRQRLRDDVWALLELDCADLGFVSQAEVSARVELRAELDQLYATYATPVADRSNLRVQLSQARERLDALIRRVLELGGTRVPALFQPSSA